MARSGMTNLIQTLREMTFAGTADWSLGTVSYWSDNQLQEHLDRNRVDFFERELRPIPRTISSASVWLRYDAPYGNLETIDSGTAIFILATSAGSVVGTANYTPDYAKGIIEFSADQGGTAYFLTGRSYDLNRAAADVWARKASYYQQSYDVRTDNHGLTRSQLYKQAKEQEEYYRAQAGAYTVDILRGDEC